MDTRLGSIFAPPSSAQATSTSILGPDTAIPGATPSFIDDDGVASYFFSMPTNRSAAAASATGYISNLGGTTESSIAGPRGTRIQFRIGASLELRTSTFLFTELGSLGNSALSNPSGTNLGAGTYRFIDSTVRVSGVNTGYRIDIPIRFVKSI